jgi:hypothetical protein
VIPAASAAREYVSPKETLSPILFCSSGVNLQGHAMVAPFFILNNWYKWILYLILS